MTDRVPSDHDALASHRVRLAGVGRTGRVQVLLPDGLGVDADDVVLSLEGDAAHARVEATLEDDLAVRGAFANARLARRQGEGENLLAAWADDHGLAPGDQLLLDVVTDGYAFGLRRPGERVIYRAREAPDRGLADIARDLEE